MRYFYDTEFIENGKTIDLISIGIIAEDGRELYAQNSSCAFYLANDWVRENVLPHLQNKVFPFNGGQVMQHSMTIGVEPWARHDQIGPFVKEFCDPEKYGKPEFWGYYSAYDHVALCQLFGTMMDLPKGWPMYTRDLKQWCDQLGNPKLPEQGKGEHHALADARWNKLVYDFLATR